MNKIEYSPLVKGKMKKLQAWLVEHFDRKTAQKVLSEMISDIEILALHEDACDDAVLTAVEARSSSPVRILRDKESFMSVNVSGLYPCGEGAGYAGGITSSAIDGIKCANALVSKYV